mmetsp:Transcript_126145/g.392711  ORF Transcript_126145/g.392711 Transcript_126145/m.392711 type:complete len:282 (-) Transcript_126145:185-1030(-)
MEHGGCWSHDSCPTPRVLPGSGETRARLPCCMVAPPSGAASCSLPSRAKLRRDRYRRTAMRHAQRQSLGVFDLLRPCRYDRQFLLGYRGNDEYMLPQALDENGGEPGVAVSSGDDEYSPPPVFHEEAAGLPHSARAPGVTSDAHLLPEALDEGANPTHLASGPELALLTCKHLLPMALGVEAAFPPHPARGLEDEHCGARRLNESDGDEHDMMVFENPAGSPSCEVEVPGGIAGDISEEESYCDYIEASDSDATGEVLHKFFDVVCGRILALAAEGGMGRP